MTNKERVMCAFEHREGDRIPYDFGGGKGCKFTKEFYLKLLDYLGFQEDLEFCSKTSQLVYASDRVLDALGCDVRSMRFALLLFLLFLSRICRAFCMQRTCLSQS